VENEDDRIWALFSWKLLFFEKPKTAYLAEKSLKFTGLKILQTTTLLRLKRGDNFINIVILLAFNVNFKISF